MNFLCYPETSQTAFFFFFPNKVRMSSTKGCLLSPPPSLPPQDNLVRRPTESKFKSENINTTVCSPKRKKMIYFQSCVSEHTAVWLPNLLYSQLPPDSSRLASSFLPTPWMWEMGRTLTSPDWGCRDASELLLQRRLLPKQVRPAARTWREPGFLRWLLQARKPATSSFRSVPAACVLLWGWSFPCL